MALEDIPRLGCGHSMDEVWAGIDQPPTEHEKHCQQCLTARTRLQRLQEATQALRESDAGDPALKPRPGLTTAIMDVARAEVRRGNRLLVRTTNHGGIEISEQAVSSLIRLAAKAVPGIHSRRCRIEIRSLPNTASENTTATTDPELLINLRVATAAGIDIPGTVEALRHEIRTAILAGLGIDAGTINITVEDLYDV